MARGQANAESQKTGESTGFNNSVAELANETTISVVAGIVGQFLVTFLGPVSIPTVLVLAAMEKASQGNFSVTSSILSGALSSSFGQVGAILIPLGVGAAAKPSA